MQAPPPRDSRTVTLTLAQVRQLRLLFALLVVLLVGAVLALGLTIPRSRAYRGLVAENMVLKEQLQDIDRRMAEVDRMLLRLRLYDQHLESLGEPSGEHGPLPDEAFANNRLIGAYEQIEEQLELGVPMEALDDEAATWLEPSDLRPAEAWAQAVQARVDTFLALAERTEPDLNELMEELEDLRALEAALPSRWPSSGRMTSGFGWRRHPFTRTQWRFHSGLDIAAGRGTPIHAPAPGRVVRAEYNGGYGRFVEIDHGFGISTTYAHCHTLAVRRGDYVEPGDLIATIGSTGRSTGPHLHFEVRLDGHPVDPLDYLPR